MLYDPKWEKTETKADPLSLEALIAWLERQPADEAYCYLHNGECLAARYNKSIGREYGPAQILANKGFDLCLEDIAVEGPRTFGAALKRARCAVIL